MKYRAFLLCPLLISLYGCNTTDATSVRGSSDFISIPLELTTHLGDKQLFVEGDEIQFLLSLEQDAYIYMFYVDAANCITQILPNSNQQSNFYSAGYFMNIPDYENHYRFTINAPFGSEAVWVFASDSSIAMELSPDSIDGIRQRIKRSSKKAYGEYVLEISTRKKQVYLYKHP